MNGVSNWNQVHGDTVMHMMGFERNWQLGSFKDAIANGYDVHTLIFLCEEHNRLWSSNDDIYKILRYLKWTRKGWATRPIPNDKGDEE
tara:strand:+ start:29 stop:292 length:264 start_codon:yes stop_codon:yes gene_type:complete